MTLPRKTPIRRVWDYAEEKRENRCRGCGRTYTELRQMGRRIELAHIAGREHDLTPAIGYEEIPLERGQLFVAPTRVIPLCGPSVDTGTCHNLQHAGRLDLLGKLTADEEIQAVADFGRLGGSGIDRAHKKLGGNAPTRTENR